MPRLLVFLQELSLFFLENRYRSNLGSCTSILVQKYFFEQFLIFCHKRPYAIAMISEITLMLICLLKDFLLETCHSLFFSFLRRSFYILYSNVSVLLFESLSCFDKLFPSITISKECILVKLYPVNSSVLTMPSYLF